MGFNVIQNAYFEYLQFANNFKRFEIRNLSNIKVLKFLEYLSYFETYNLHFDLILFLYASKREDINLQNI